MNFQALKGMIDSLVKTYKCPECSHDVRDNNVDIVGAAGTTINIDIECPKCHKHSMIKSEILSVDLSNTTLSNDKLHQIKTAIEGLNGNVKANISINSDSIINIDAIKDDEITDLNNDLKKADFNVSDLFTDEEK